MNKSIISITLKCVVLGLVFTFIIYSINFEHRIARYFSIYVFYFAAYIFLSTKNKQTFSKLFLPVVLLATPILIDASVLITAPNLAPLRFPFASTFSILGVYSGYIYKNKSLRHFFLTLFCSCIYFILCIVWIIPIIIYSMETRNLKTPVLKKTFFSSKYLTATYDTIVLSKKFNKHTIVDLFFVGCPPCEEKKEMLYEVAKETQEKSFSILLICDGSISSMADFVQFVKVQKPDSHIQYLYDYENMIPREIGKIKGFPYEIVFNGERPIKTYIGFNSETKEFMKTERLKLLAEK